ncbi:Calcitonin receptor, partial [Stegodyphus mimosarum]
MQRTILASFSIEMVVRNYRILLSGFAPTIITIFFMNFINCDKITNDIDESQQFCRASGGLMLPLDQFPSYSCATCYRHIDERLFENGTKFQQAGLYLRNRTSGELFEAAFANTTSPIFKTFRTRKVENLWIQCCQAAVRCCENMRRTPPSSDQFFCPRTWDGWNCWPDTPNGTVAKAICPSYIYFHSDEPQCTHYATKTCWENSTWFRNHKGNEYSNYSTCGQSKV